MNTASKAIGASLAWLGRQGTQALAATIFIAILAPELGALAKPLLPGVVFLLLFLAFLRVNPVLLRHYASRPKLIVVVITWTALLLPALLCWIYRLIGLDRALPDLNLALVLQAATSPMMSTPAIAALLGLDAALVLIGMIGCTSLVAITAPLFIRTFAVQEIIFSPLFLGLRLVAMLIAAASLAALVRKMVGSNRVSRQAEKIDGINVLALFIFLLALMSDVGTRLTQSLELIAALTGLAFLLTALSAGITALVFGRIGLSASLSLGLLASQRNMGLMLATIGGMLPDTVWLYFGIAQLPIYLLPLMVAPLARRVT